jgi:macrolide-specific efflux system membrane fusion protein
MKLDNKKIVPLVLAAAVLVLAVFLLIRTADKGAQFTVREVKPSIGEIRISITTTGVVEPQNRLEIKPPISGRIEEIYVKEGDIIKQGDILAVMSSTDRAALLDTARAQGDDVVEYWKDVYKATPLISPIDGEVIVRGLEPGQTVTSDTAVLVLSNRLIVNAQVDETDIGRVKTKQNAVISLDAYPEYKINASVGHIAYESKLVNNVIIYEVDIIPEEIPDFFRSGMSATVDIIVQEKDGVLTLPIEAVIMEYGGNFVLKKDAKTGQDAKTPVKLGLQNSDNVEIVSGVGQNDTVIVRKKQYTLPKKKSTSSPFLPGGAKEKKK